MNRLLTILLLAAGTVYGQIDNPPTSVNIVDATTVGRAVLTASNAAAARTNLGLGEASEVLFDSVRVINHESATATNFYQLGIRSVANGYGGFYAAYDGAYKFAFAAGSSSNNLGDVILFRANIVELVKPFQFIGTNATLNAATTRTNLGLYNTNAPAAFAALALWDEANDEIGLRVVDDEIRVTSLLIGTSAPADTTNVVKWIRVTQGTNYYRLPLYQ